MPQSVWVKTGALQWWCDWKPHKWVDVRVALEQFTGHDGARDSILFVYYVVHEEKKVGGGPWGSCRGWSGWRGPPGEGTQSPGRWSRGARPRTACGVYKALAHAGSIGPEAGRCEPLPDPRAPDETAGSGGRAARPSWAGV